MYIYIPDIDDARAYSDRCKGIFQDGRASYLNILTLPLKSNVFTNRITITAMPEIVVLAN
jgi:hypothetical protein